MTRNTSNASGRGTRFARGTKMLLHEWSFPLAVLVAWSLAVTYTLVLVNRPPPRVQTDTRIAPSPQPVVHAPASSQQARRPSWNGTALEVESPLRS
jgi:hypothetical protein